MKSEMEGAVDIVTREFDRVGLDFESIATGGSRSRPFLTVRTTSLGSLELLHKCADRINKQLTTKGYLSWNIRFINPRKEQYLPAELRSETTTARRIAAPPGRTLNLICKLFFGPVSLENIFQPLISDMQIQYFDALQEGAKWRARMCLVRGYYSFGAAVLYQLPFSIGKIFKLISKIN